MQIRPKVGNPEKFDFSEVDDPELNFANGGYGVQRSKSWLEAYKADILKKLDIEDFTPWTYGWFRCLDDGGHKMYPAACRVLQVCPICFKEWGQPYYADQCMKSHPDGVKGIDISA